MAPSNTTPGGAGTKKRSNSQQDRDDPDGKRVKTSSPGEDSEPSPTPAKRGIIQPPTDEEWAQVVATGVTEGGDGQLLSQVIDVPRSTPATSATPSAGPAQPFPFNTRQSKSAGKAPAEAGGSRGPSTSTPRPVPGPRPDDSDFTTDEEILHKWTDLETLIEQYVQECIVDKMPKDDELIDNDYDDDDDHNRLFEAFRHLVGHKDGRDVAGEEGGADDSMAHAMCQNATYAPYLFQITIWKYLIDALIARGNHNWAVDLDMGIHNGWRPTRGPGAGLGISTDGLTSKQTENVPLVLPSMQF